MAKSTYQKHGDRRKAYTAPEYDPNTPDPVDETDFRSEQARQAVERFHKETDSNDKASNFITPRHVPDYLTNEGGIGGSAKKPEE